MATAHDPGAKKVFVMGIPMETSKGYLALFFKNAEKSGGGAIESLDYTQGEETAVLTFTDPTVTERVLEKKSVTFRDSSLSLHPLQWDQKSVLVTGCGDSPDLDYLELLYASQEDSGGGPVEKIESTEDGVIVTFTNTEDSQRVLTKKTVESEYGELTASVPLLLANVWDGQTVEVTGFTETLPQDELQFLYEDKDTSGGGPLKSPIKVDYTDCVALLVFEKEEDAAEVLERSPISWEEHTLVARKPKPKSIKRKKPVETWRVLTVSGFSPNLSLNLLKLFFKNPQKSGGGPIKSLRLNDAKNKCVVEFEDEKCVDSVLKTQKETAEGFKLFNNALKVDACDFSQVETFLGDSEEAPKEPTTKTEDLQKSMSDTKKPKTQTENKAEETEKSKPSEKGGGDTKKIPEEPMTETEGYQKSGSDTKAEEIVEAEASYQEKPKREIQPRAVEVHGLPDVSEHSLRMFFEVAKFSGGGPIESCSYDKDEGKAIIIFIEAAVCKRVHEKYTTEGLSMEGKNIRVSVLLPVSQRVDTSQALEQNVVSLQEVELGMTARHVTRYFEASIGQCKVKNVIFGTKEGTALVEFSKFPGYEALYEVTCQKPLGRRMLSLDGVPLSTSVEVYGVEGFSSEKVHMYFEHPRSEGGDVADVRLEPESNCAIVTFSDHEVSERVSAHRNHMLEKQKLIVKKHYDCIGIIPPDFDTSGLQKPPPDVTESVGDERIIDFLLKHATNKQDLEQQMGTHHAVVQWKTSADAGEVTICYRPPQDVRIHPKTDDWTKAVTGLLKTLLERFTVVDITIQNVYWDEFYNLYQAAKIPTGGEAEVEMNCDSGVVSIMGEVNAVKHKKEQIEELDRQAVAAVQKRENIITETCEFSSAVKIRLMDLQKVFTQLERKYEGISIEADHSGKLVKVTGQRDHVHTVKMEILTKCADICSERFNVSVERASFLKTPTAKAYLEEKMADSRVVAAWEVGTDTVHIHASSGTELNNAMSVFDKSILEKKTSILLTAEAMRETSRWNNITMDLKSKYGDKLMAKVQMTGKSYLVILIGCDDVFEDASKYTQRFIDENSIVHDFVNLSPAKFNYIRDYMRDDLLNEVEKYQRKFQMKIKLRQNPSETGLSVECNAQGLTQAKSIINGLVTRIQYEDHRIQKMGMSKYFTDEKGQAYLLGLQTRHKVIILKDREIDADSSKAMTTTSTFRIRAKVTLPTQKTLYLATGDLTQFPVDALVNAADPKLDHGGGVAKAIVDAGGQEIQTECTRYIQSNGHMKPGDVYVSTAGKLPCSKVIHTVGPKWKGGSYDEEAELIFAVQGPLWKASQLQMKRLSMPAISTGKYGFPQESACNILITAIMGILRQPFNMNLEEVYVIDNNIEVIQTCIKISNQFKDPGTIVDISPGIDDHSKVVDTSGMADYAADFSGGKAFASAITTTRVWQAGRSNNQIETVNGLKVSLVAGSIVDQTVDAVVNLTGTDLDLSQGMVSRLILRQVGRDVQKECDRLCPPGGIKCGDVVTTSGGNSAWKKIYHSSVTPYHNPTAKTEMTRFLCSSFTKAHADGLTSIALPSVGTGSLQFPSKESARMIFEEVLKFSTTNKNTSLKEVKVVVFDKPILQTFDEHMKELLKSTPTHSGKKEVKSTTDLASGAYWKAGPGKHDLTTEEGVEVLLIKGSVVDQQVDAIVNLTSDDLNLSNGQVSKMILKKAGDGIQDECKKTPLKKRGDLVSTSGGQSHWKKIYHSACSHYHSTTAAAQELSRFVYSCLEEANADGLRTIAFPSLGTGSLKFPSDEVAGIMYTKIREFSTQHIGTSVSQVKLVVFDDKVMKKFKKHVDDLQSGKSAYAGARPKYIKAPNRSTKPGANIWSKGQNPYEIVTGRELTVQVCNGSVVGQKVDAIVNLTSRNLDLSQGHVSKEIVKKGGKVIQDELQKKRPGGIRHGEMVGTTGGKLQCRHIYHGACSSFKEPAAMHEMGQFIFSCLKTAHFDNLQSLAFPSLGTGSLSFPPSKVADLMFSCVLDFSKEYTKTSLKLVKLVVYDQNDLKEFQKQQEQHLAKKTIRKRIMDGLEKFGDLLMGESGPIKPSEAVARTRQEVRFRIYGTDSAVLREVIRQIDETCKKEIHEKVLDSSLDKAIISKLSAEHVTGIESLAVGFDVNIDLQMSPVNKIVLQGLKENVHQVSTKIQELFRVLEKQARDKEEVELLSKQAQWQFQGKHGWEDYQEDISVTIEKAFIKEEQFAQWREEEKGVGFDVRLTFATMTEVTMGGGPKRNYKVRRQGEGGASVSLPDHWDEVPPAKVYTTKSLNASSPEYKEVKDTFDASMKRSRVSYKSIVEIQRVQNPRLYKAYMVTKAEMDTKHTSNNPLERTVWHATGKDVLSEINANGFNRNFSGDKHGAWYGKGVYFATEAGTSARMYSGKGPENRFMYMCKALTGDYTQVKQDRTGEKNVRTAPPKDPANPSIKYDSVVDNMVNPIEWVIFTDSQCLGRVWGQGVYFATEAGLSVKGYARPDANGHKFLYMAKILSGDYVIGSRDFKTAPPRDPSNPHIKYDSVVNDPKEPTIWVIFTDHQMYAEYIITLTD